jgi:hypothetical protein
MQVVQARVGFFLIATLNLEVRRLLRRTPHFYRLHVIAGRTMKTSNTGSPRTWDGADQLHGRSRTGANADRSTGVAIMTHPSRLLENSCSS